MLSAPKTIMGAFTRKIIALVMAYSFLATSLWSLALPGQGLSVGRSAKWVDWSTPREYLEAMARAAAGNTRRASSSTHSSLRPTIFSNLAELNSLSHVDDNQAPSNCTVHSTQPSGDDGEDQDQRRDEHRSYQHHNYKYGSDDDSHGPPTPIVPTGVTIFGPQTYTRTTGATDDFTSTITVPAWDAQPFFLHVVNGDTAGNHRVSSAGISINGVTIIDESVFNQKVASIDCAIQLTAQSTLKVDLDSKPGSFLTINVLGKSLDHTPPVVTIVSPAPAINTPQPHLDIRYQDLVGTGETVASGVNITTLQVLLDGVDRTGLFTRRADEATADLPPSLALAPGLHTISASIQDNAENLGTASEQFQVNTAAPVLQILQPAAGSYLNSTTPQIVLAYSSALGLNLASLKVTDNGIDITAAFNKTATGASGTTPALSQGGNTIVASISDQAGNQTTTSLVFNVDTTPPVINIVHPATGSNHGSSSVEYLIQYSDDQAIDPGTLVVTVDGNPVAVTPAPTSASGTVTLTDGASHVITASIKDKAGNPSTTASSTFSVDTSLPSVHIVQPATSAILKNATPQFQVTYSETSSGVDTGTFKATVDGTDVTGLFTVGAANASATLQAPLADGSHTFFAQIASTVGNVGHDTNQVLIDTIKPQVTIVSPPGIVNTTTPGAAVQYSDSGSGIDPASVHITLDGVDVTGSFGVSSSSATGTLGAGSGLSEGPHQFAVTVADKAGNVAQPSVSFLVDVTPPVAAFSSPADGSFLNNPQPAITLNYSDSVSGVDQSSIHIFLQQGTAAETEITSLFTFSGGQATATIPASSPLTPGTYHLRATVADRAGNPTPVNAAFVLDTVAPAYAIQAPAANAFLNTSTPTFTVVYQDDSSGVDTSKFALRVDGIDRTSRLTVTNTGASGALQPSDALPDGTHQVEVTVVDRAGNSAPIVPQSFLVDTVPPVIAIGAPLAASFTNNNHPTVSVTYSDTGSGVDVTTLQVLIDGVDHTAEFTATATGATGSPATALLDGSHTISASIKDLAGNPSSPATTGFTIDTVLPVITATAAPAPNAAGWNTTDVTVSFVCSDNASGIVLCPPPQVVSTEGKAQVITGTVSDGAGNQATASVTLNIEKSAPTITASLNPAANAGGWNNSDVTVSFQCSPSASDIVSCQAPVTISTEGKNQQVSGTVTDQAGKTGTTSATVNLDKTPPLITAKTAPPPNTAGWNNTDVVVTYTCTDALSGVAQCPSPATVSTEGAKQNIVALATDQAGNTTPVSTVLSIDKTPPTVTATATPAPNGAGWNKTNVTVNFICADNLSGVATCPGQQTLASEGQNQNVSGQATDIAGNTATGSISVSIDKTLPTIVQISTPDHISQLHSGQVSVTVNDNFTVAQVVISVNGTSLGTFTTPPYQANLQVPAGANPGDTLTVTVVATDQAGNSQTASRGVSVAADGVIVGQVLSDATGSPVQGANVQVISASGQTDTTDDRGRYSFQASDSHVFLSATNPGSTTVQREVFVQPGAGTVAVDARITPLAPPVSTGSLGGTLKAGPISVSVPAASVPDGTNFQLTALSGQGLPGLLPLGWSPLAAFDLRASSAATNLPTAISSLPNVVAHLVTYDPSLHAWTLVTPNLQPASGTASFTVPSTGAYALVAPDTTTPPIPVPNVGAALTGIAVQALDPAASSGGSLNPAVLPAGGGTATATLGVQSPTFVPSGTVIQANVSEKFSLASGDLVSEQTRSEDIVLYNALAPANSTMGALFPVTPSHQYSNTQLLTGKVHLDILAGREGVRGQPGGNDPLTLSDGIATISVPGAALSQDTAIAVQSVALEDFVPTSTTLSALQEVLVDFSGETLNTPAQLSIPASGLDPTHTFLLTQVQRISGVPHIVAVALAQVNGGNLTSVPSPGLPGVISGGEYLFYDISGPSGFVQGTVSSSAGTVQALVQTDSLPIASITGADGRYIVPALQGTLNVKASAPNTSLSGTASVALLAGQTVVANIQLAGSANTAVVSPADGSLGVPPSTIITVTAPVPINPTSINQSNLVLFKGTPSSPGISVPLQQFVLSVSGTVLTLAPVNNLDPATQYTVQVVGMADGGGGAIVVPTSTFTTKAVAALSFDPSQITFGFPDQNSSIHVSAPAGALPPGTTVLIVDVSNGTVLSLTALNDGSLSGDFAGTVNDVLQVTATAPTGATNTFTRSQFVAPDGTTAVGAGGGTVTGAGGVELRIPAGTFDQAAKFKIQALAPTDFSDHPQFAPDAVAAGGIRVNFDGVTPFKQEVKLAFPKPAGAPDNAVYFVFRRLTATNGNVFYEVVDEASQEGTGADAKIVTHSPPYRGFVNFTNAFNTLTNTVDSIPGRLQAQADFTIQYVQAITDSFKIQSGAILGVVMRATIPVGGAETTFVPVENATVQSADSTPLIDQQTKKPVTTTDSQGRFTLWDPNYNGGTRALLVTSPEGQSVTVLANEVMPGDDISVIPDVIRALFATFIPRYRNVAYVNATFPALPPPPSAPALQIQLFQPTASGLQQLQGLAPTNTDLTIQIRSTTADVPNLTLQILGTTGGPSPLTVAPTGNDGPISLFTSTYNTANQGTFRLQATVIPPLGGNPVTTTYDFRAIQGALNGGNNTAAPGPPTVIYTSPRGGEQSVDIRIAPQVFFSEPVTNITSSTVQILANGAAINTQISGVTPSGLLLNSVAPTDVVTSILVQPAQLLQYTQTYTLHLTTAILDTDKDANGNPAPNNLDSTVDVAFQTQGPEIESRPTDAFASAGVFVANDTAFLEKISNLYDRGTLMNYDVANPVQPFFIGVPLLTALKHPFANLDTRNPIEGRPAAITGEDNNVVAVSQGYKAMIAVAASSYATPRPSNVHLYLDDGTRSGNIHVLGSVSLTTGPLDGMVNSIVVRGDRLYAATWRKGIQVVDINRVGLDAATQTSPFTINTLLYTEGQGFATDAVVNTVPVAFPESCQTSPTCNPEYKADILNIKVGDYVAAGQSATWVIGTGNVQPASSAPAGTNPASIVAVNPATDEVFRSTPDDGNGTFLFRGWALDLGQIQNPAFPNVSNIAVAVGETNSNSSAMFVLDMADPRSPATLSMKFLDASLGTPTDVLIRDEVAAVAFRHVTVLYDISDPTNPINIGTIGSDSDPIGGKIAFNSDGSLLFSSYFTPGSSSDPVGGLHIAEFKAGAYVNLIAPVLAKEDNPSDPNSTRTNEVDFQINTIVVPTGSRVDSAQLQLFVNGSPIPCPQAGAQPAPTCPVTLNGTQGMVKFKAETLTRLPKDLTAQVVYNVHNSKPLTSAQAPLHLGVVKILVDLNNDTIVDDADRQIQLKNAPLVTADKAANVDPATDTNINRFAFWESDGSKLNISGPSTSDTGPAGVTADAQEGALQDYATLKIHAEALPPTGYTLGIKLQGASWALTEKAPGPKSCIDSSCTQVDIAQLSKSKEYLSDSNTVQIQLSKLDGGTKLCTNTSDPSGAPGECISDSSGFLKLDSLSLGDTVALFRCIQCGTTSTDPANPNGNRSMESQVLPSSGGSAVALDHLDLDIRPIPGWTVAYSNRNEGTGVSVDANLGTPTPLGVAQPVPGFADINANDPYQPTTALVFVHGYNVDTKTALQAYDPAFIKRLYWTATPILPPQKVTPVFFLWPGDLGPFPAGARFPLDEFRALESGVAFADFIKNIVKRRRPTVQVLAHSLGNLVVNSALSSDILAPNDINLYLMNEAALPAESLVTPNEASAMQMNFQYLDYGPAIPILGYGIRNSTLQTRRGDFLTLHAAQLNDDPANWQTEFNNSIQPDAVSCVKTDTFGDLVTQTVTVIGPDKPTVSSVPIPYRCLTENSTFQGTLLQGWNTRVQQSGVKPAPQYDLRWSQTRGNIWDPASADSTVPNRGPWAGLFQGNLSKTRIVNSYNAGDCVLNYIYYLNAYTKPYRSLITAVPQVNYADSHKDNNPFPRDITATVADPSAHDYRGDNHDRQFWADLNVNYESEAGIIFAAYGGATSRNKNIIRQWAEVGLWFPPTAGPMGSASQALAGSTVSADPSNPGDIGNPNNWSNIDLTFVGNLQRDGKNCSTDFINAALPWESTISHTFMPGAKPLSEVWKAYKLFRKLLTGDTSPDPDPPQP